jgi:hypothetical protein
MIIDIDRKHLIRELAWCLDMEYPLKIGGKKIIARLSSRNRHQIARGMAGLLSAYRKKDGSHGN